MLTSELIEAVRAKTDEDNTNDLSSAKIIAALNRALQRLARLSVRHYPELLRRTTADTALTGSTLTLPAMSQAYHQLSVDAKYGSTYRTLSYTSTANVAGMDRTDSTSSYPMYYTQSGNILSFYPQSTASVRVRYQLKPPELVLEQGRIVDFDIALGYVYLDTIGTGLSTSVSDRTAFFNIIDQFTGDIKATLQVNSLTTASGRIVIKTTGLGRTNVYGWDVVTALPDTIAKDDLVCLAKGSCMPLYFREYTDFLLQFAVNDIKSTFGTKTEMDAYDLKDVEEDVKLMWSQRPYGARIKQNNPVWNAATFRRPRR